MFIKEVYNARIHFLLVNSATKCLVLEGADKLILELGLGRKPKGLLFLTGF